MNAPSYRASHTAAGYAVHYDDLYGRGYFHQLWHEIESPLLIDELTALRARGARRALDFACGTGRVTETVSMIFPGCVGIDVSAEMLQVARQRCPAVRFIRSDLTTDRSALGESFDVVTAFRFFLNAEDALRADALEAIGDVLTPGGVLIASFQWASTSPAGQLYRLRNRWRGTDNPRTASASRMSSLFAAHGFRVVRVRRYGLWPRMSKRHGRVGRAGVRIGERVLQRAKVVGPVAQNFLLVATKALRC